MTIDVHVLGTASARPTAERAVSGSLVKGPNGIAVIDAGEGFQTRFTNPRRHLKLSGGGDTLKPSRINVLAFTHGHLDHTWGALPWLQSMDLENRQEPLLIIGPTSKEAIESLQQAQPFPDTVPPADLARQFVAWFALGADRLRMPVRWVLGDVKEDAWVEIDPVASTVTPLPAMPQPEGWRSSSLRCLPTVHTVPSCGWMVRQDASPGAFDRARADELNLNTKQRARLARGENVQGPDGNMLEASWFRGEPGSPISVLISGDTASSPPSWPSGLAPTLLVHEATFLNEQQDKAHEHLHSTAVGAVQSARSIGAKHIALTHYSNRIKDETQAKREAETVADGLPLVALNDGDRLFINDSGRLVHKIRVDDGWNNTSISPNR